MLKRNLAILILAAAIAGCATTSDDDVSTTTTTEPTPAPTTTATAEATASPLPPPTASNPLLEPWTGPYGGVPPFDRVRVADFKPAHEAAMAENLAEVERIANDPAPPTFQNTIAALERTGRTLDRVGSIYGVWSSTMSDDAFQNVEREMAPKLAAFSDQITQNVPLFRRIEAVYNSPEKASLTPEQQRLTWV
ncbi:MAG TPA: M3 family peptidase, partial [Thermoanaerobaculia bacterium]|nr:M3 family peptidase [Thermoanaerobaculia bacterium]